MVLEVHYSADPADSALELLRAELDSGVHLSIGEQPPSNPQYQVLVNGRPSRELLAASPLLESLVIPYAGIPESTHLLLADYPYIKVYNLHHNAAPTAEMAVALLLAAAKFLVPIDRAFRAHDWTPRYQSNPSFLLEGKTALILGLGHIGQRVGLICQALGMRVVGIRRRLSGTLLPSLQAEVHPPEALDSLLPDAQVLIITLPHTPETGGLIGAQQLARMTPGGILVNVGRGRIVDQGALYHALADGTLAAAGLDVWYNYPKTSEERSSTAPADFPFHQLDNIVMSPHRAGGSREIEQLRMRHLAGLLNDLNNGRPTTNQVDIRAGY